MRELTILCRQETYAVAVKPAGVISERGTAEKPGMADLLAEALSIPADSVFPVHRLDREVSGVMVFALNAKAASFLTAAVGEHRFYKTYLAIVPGVPEPREGRWTDLLYHDPGKNKTYIVHRRRRGVREAVLSYRTAETALPDGKQYSLLEIELLTGRTHQIRVQCAGRSMPLPGDRRYGGEPADGICLYALRLTFPRPSDGEEETWTAPLPAGGLWNAFPALREAAGQRDGQG